MSDIETTVARVLAEHRWSHTRDTHCSCGFRTPLAQLAVEGHDTHVAAKVAEALAGPAPESTTITEQVHAALHAAWLAVHVRRFDGAYAGVEVPEYARRVVPDSIYNGTRLAEKAISEVAETFGIDCHALRRPTLTEVASDE